MEIFWITESIRDVIDRLGLSLSDLPDFVRRHGFEGIEISDRQLSGHSDAALSTFQAACERLHLGIVVDVGCDLTLSSERRLQGQVRHALALTRTAKALKARGIRIWLGGQGISIQQLVGGTPKKMPERDRAKRDPAGPPVWVKRLLMSRLVKGVAHVLRRHLPSRVLGSKQKMHRAVSSLRRIVENRHAQGLFFAVENHWGISARPETLLAVIQAVDSPRLGTCPDFANFPRDVNRYEGLRRLAPRAFLAHAKLVSGGSREEREVDFLRCLEILKACAFDGILAVEHDGPGDGLASCLTQRRLIRDFWKEAESVPARLHRLGR